MDLIPVSTVICERPSHLKSFEGVLIWQIPTLTSNSIFSFGVFPHRSKGSSKSSFTFVTVPACIIKDNTLPFKGSFMQVTVFIVKKKHELEFIASNFIPHSEGSRMLGKHLCQML